MHRQHSQSEQSAIGDQSVPMFHDDVTHRIHLAWALQATMQYYSRFHVVSVFDETSRCSITSHYPMPELNVVINLYKLALLPTPSINKAFQ